MGQSTNGQICFGVLLEEGAQLPWGREDQSLEGWWRDLQGYRPANYLWTDEGERKPGVSETDITAYFKEQRDFDAAHPCPVRLVNVCSGECPIYMIAAPSTFLMAYRGDPKPFTPSDLSATLDMGYALEVFCQKHGIAHEQPPQWYLSSYWG